MQNRIIINKKEIQEIINKIRDSKTLFLFQEMMKVEKIPFLFLVRLE